VKVTGGGRGIAAIAAHLRYISKAGRLDIEDDRGVVRHGKEALHDLVEQWRHGGMPIDDVGHRREAFNLMLSMPRGTDPQVVRMAAREFARDELRGHRYVMVLHDHQANPHVHLSVKAASMRGDRLNPRKTDLHRWRETFAEKLRGYGIDAEATRQATRGVFRNADALWRLKAGNEGRLQKAKAGSKRGLAAGLSRKEALLAWGRIADALSSSDQLEDRQLASSIRGFVQRQPVVQAVLQQRQRDATRGPAPTRDRQASQEAAPRRQGPDMTR
jgi:hypothetical protein